MSAIEPAPETGAAASPPATETPVVGIGASAGGLDAFAQILGHLPATTGMAFVLIQHLDPNHQSGLAELLAKSTTLPISQAMEGAAVRANHVYVIQPNTSLTIERGVLHVSPRREASVPHAPLDIFFRSLAQDRQARAIGVILSGTGSDGSSGLADIKAAGGITLAEDPKSAAFSAMPLAAIATGCVDRILPPAAIAAELVRLSQHDYFRTPAASTTTTHVDAGDDTGANAEMEPAGSAHGADVDTDGAGAEAFNKILRMLHTASRVNFSDYRDTTIRRRIARRMALLSQDSLADYARFIEAQPEELDALFADILINVTSFFRDPEVFDTLQRIVFPKIVSGKSLESPIRIWVPGCSTGQEAYSLAMALLEFLDGEPVRPPIQIFGTDISDSVAIEKARAGFYPHAIDAEVSPERLRRFFTREDGGYRIAKAIRDMCVFARHNLAADPPFSRMDLVSCRNVLIYLSGNLQKRLIPMFHYALLPEGYLLLGAAESVGRYSELFGVADKKSNLYLRLQALARPYPNFAGDEAASVPPAPGATTVERPAAVSDILKEADRVLLTQYAPPAVVVDENLEILQFRGITRPYLEPASGQASLNLLKMARDSLFLELRDVVGETREKNTTVRRRNVRFRDEHGLRTINLEVRPIRLPNLPGRCFLILFQEDTAAYPNATAPTAPANPTGPAAANADSDALIAQLRQELVDVREYLQAIIDQQSVANEELQSANEEIRSANEELQSTNEELQTAKEELQSTNEELRTVNDELSSRSHELTQLNDDLNNTLASVRIPIVMLGRDLRIRRFTPTAAELMNLIPTDIGRPFADIQPAFDVPGMEARLLEVIATVAAQELEVPDRAGHWYQMRLHPYRTADHRIDGVVIVLLDVDERRRAHESSKRAMEVAEAAGKAKDRFLATLSHELRTPLTPALAAVSLLRAERDLSPQTLASLEIIHRNVVAEAMLIDDLLDLTRVAKGKLQLNVQKLDLQALMRNAVDDVAAEYRTKGLDLSLEAGEMPECIRGDAARLRQVLSNLLRNALKFTPPGGRVVLRCSKGSGGKSRVPGADCAPPSGDRACPELRGSGSVVVEVSDNGMGIAPEKIGRIFDAFDQGDVTISRQFGGLGLGLAICRAIVGMHGGTIAAHSAGEGKGATFRTELPLCNLQFELCDCARGKARPMPLQQPQRKGPLTVLLVEDHPDTNQVIALILKQEGHHVRAALNLATALELLRQHKFDLVLSDLGLPDGNGLDLIRQARAIQPHVKALALSGFGMDEDVQASRAAGFDEHLTKPLELEKLLDAVSRVTSAPA